MSDSVEVQKNIANVVYSTLEYNVIHVKISIAISVVIRH